jgi:hypothetical protein
MKGNPDRSLRAFFRSHRWILLLMALLLAERLAALSLLGVRYNIGSDDLSYVKSGLRFAQTGMITMHNEYPSAQIMPGMPCLIGLMSLLLGEGDALWLGLKLAWIAMGTLTAWFVYRSVRLFAPGWCGVGAALPLLSPEFVWTDNLILTETPFTLCFTALLYYTLRLGKERDRRSFLGCLIFYLLGLMFKANIGLYPLFAMVYLLARGYGFRRLLRQGLILGCALVCVLAPWTIRNALRFHDFIPLTYGSGNPMLLGTYQGVGYPADEELDYETHVEAVVRREYADYFGTDGEPLPQYAKYVSLARDGVKARYRLSVWAERDWKSLALSYGILKPLMLINGTFYWQRVFNVPGTVIQNLRELGTVLWLGALGLCLLARRHRGEALFLSAVYLGNILIYAMTYAFGRYNLSLLPARFLVLGLGLSALWDLLQKRRRLPACH